MLEVIKGTEKFDQCDVVSMDLLREKHPERFNKETGQMDGKWFEETIRDNKYIYVRHDVNSLSFTLQKGPVKENGVNGCQVDALVSAAHYLVLRHSEKFPCQENNDFLAAMVAGLTALKKRKANRVNREVEGENKV